MKWAVPALIFTIVCGAVGPARGDLRSENQQAVEKIQGAPDERAPAQTAPEVGEPAAADTNFDSESTPPPVPQEPSGASNPSAAKGPRTNGPIPNIIRSDGKWADQIPEKKPELALGDQNAQPPMAPKKCLRLDVETGYGPDVVANFNFPDADIVEIAETLGRITCKNFIYDKEVKGRVSIINNSKITVGDAWKAFLTSLDINGFSIIPSGKFLRIARQRDAKDKQIKTYAENSPNTDEYITRILPLKYISAEEVSRTLRNFMPPNTRILAYEQTNTLIITDTGSNVKKLVDMIAYLDVERFDERIEVIPVHHAGAPEMAKILDQLITGPAGGAPGNVPPGNIAGFRNALSGVRKTKSGGTISRVIPDERTNSLIVSANEQGLAEIKALVAKLDTKAGRGDSNRVRVIYLQYADAEQVAQTLANLASGGAPRPQGTTPGAGAPAVTSTQLFEGAIKVSADKATNSLVITGTPADFNTLAQVINRLDVPRDQVYVEAVIMEMTMDRGFELGTSIASPTSGIAFLPNNDFGKFLLNPLELSGLVLGFQGGRGSKTFNLPNGQSVTIASVQGLVRALAQSTNSNVLATPQLLTLDNQEANIEISENIPIPTVTAIQGSTATSITREKIALSLKIKPQINKASEFVKLEIDQKLEDISNRTPPAGVANLAFATASRTSKTTVVVQDGDTVALGGLFRDKITESTTKIPLLGDIPILGWLFRSKSTATLKQNLLVFITPRIIKQYQQMRGILDRKIRERDEYIEQYNGGDDPFMNQKRKMIESLPPLVDLKNNNTIPEGTDTAGATETSTADKNAALNGRDPAAALRP